MKHRGLLTLVILILIGGTLLLVARPLAAWTGGEGAGTPAAGEQGTERAVSLAADMAGTDDSVLSPVMTELRPAASFGRDLVPGVFVQGARHGSWLQTPWVEGSAVRLGWNELEPEAGQYDFQPIDAWLNTLAAHGKRGILAVALRCEDVIAAQPSPESSGSHESNTSDESNGSDELEGSVGSVEPVKDGCTPAWALAWDPVMVNDVPRLNYLAPQVQARVTDLIAALARRYARDERLSHVEIDLGFSGTASPCPSGAVSKDRTEQCAAYAQAYGDASDDWEAYLSGMIQTYTERFQAAGGAGATPLQVNITGTFLAGSERAILVNRARELGLGLHSMDLAASFVTGGSQDGRCAQEWWPGDAGYQDGHAYLSPWVPLERYWQDTPVSFEFSQWLAKSELALTDEENVWWSVLNALDKHTSVLLANEASLQWEAAYQFFQRYAGRDARSTPDAWVALRGAPDAWCADTGAYEWFLHHRPQASGGSDRMYWASEPGGRAGRGWQGAFSRGTDLAGQRPSLYFDVDDDFLYGGERLVQVEVTYWDGTPEMTGLRWELAYDSVGKPNRVAGSVTLGGTDQWLRHPFVLLDATFRNRLPDAAGQPGSDLRVTAVGGDVRLHMVRVEELLAFSDPTMGATQPSTGQAVSPSSIKGVPVTPIPGRPVTPEAPTPDAQQAMPSMTPVVASTPTPQLTVEALRTPSLPADVLRYQMAAGRTIVVDAFVEASQPDANHGAANTLVVNGDGQQVALLRFDLSDVPADARLLGAWLDLTTVGRSGPQTMQADLFRLLTPWDAGQVTWSAAGEGQSWQAPGLQSGEDYAAEATARLDLLPVGVVQASVTELVASWIKHPDQNHGLVLIGEGDAGAAYYLASSEWLDVTARPRLRLRFDSELPASFMLQPTLSPLAAPVDATPVPTPTVAEGPLGASAMSTSLSAPEGIEPLTVDMHARIAEVSEGEDAAGNPSLEVTAYLYTPSGEGLECIGLASAIDPSDGADSVGPGLPVVRLWGAAGQEPAQLLSIGRPEQMTVDGRTFLAWTFPPIDRLTLQGDAALLHLFVTVDGRRTAHNVVTLGAAHGTDYPQPIEPQRGAQALPKSVDASIEILWPHDDAEIHDAEKANLTIALYRQGTREMIPAHLGFLPTVRLHWSLDNDVDVVATGEVVAQPRLVQTPWFTYYLWDVSDVDVSAAREPEHYVSFWVEVDGIDHSTNVWSHGQGVRQQLTAPYPFSGCSQ